MEGGEWVGWDFLSHDFLDGGESIVRDGGVPGVNPDELLGVGVELVAGVEEDHISFFEVDGVEVSPWALGGEPDVASSRSIVAVGFSLLGNSLPVLDV